MIYFHDLTEWWPVILLVREGEDSYDGKKTAEFTADEVARIEAAFKEFASVQDLLNERFGYTD